MADIHNEPETKKVKKNMWQKNKEKYFITFNVSKQFFAESVGL